MTPFFFCFYFIRCHLVCQLCVLNPGDIIQMYSMIYTLSCIIYNPLRRGKRCGVLRAETIGFPLYAFLWFISFGGAKEMNIICKKEIDL